jgi:hypothetical protein
MPTRIRPFQRIEGFTGPTGPTGPDGDTGGAGPTGSASTVTGPTGPEGAPGGPTGPTGPDGAASTVTGPAGAAGAAGPTGPTGAAGAASTVTGPTGSAGNIGATGPTGAVGAASTVTGPTGPGGPAGTDGDDGAAGAAGPTGPTGPDGGLGPTGPGGAGSGDVLGPAASIASEIALFDGTTGKLLKRATGTGIVKATAGVYATDASLDQSESHDSPDTDTATTSLHHTLGTGANQSAAGDHAHAALYQPLDADLTTIAGLTATTNNMIQSVGSAWASRTPAQVIAGLGLDADIATLALPASTTISAFGATLVDDADAAAGRSTLVAAPAAAKYITQTTDSELSAEQALGALATGILKNTTTTGVLSIAAAGTDYQAADADLTTIAGLTATTDNVIQSVSSAWASRTPAQLKATLALVKADVGLGNVDNTSDSAKLAAVITQSVVVQFGDGTNVLTVNEKRRFSIPVAHTLIRWRILSSVSGSVVFDVWRDTFANYPPVVGDSISTSKPTLSSALTAEDSTITDWTEVGAAGDVYIVNVDSVTSVVDCVLELWYTRALNV